MFWKRRIKQCDPKYVCAKCGRAHDELPALAFSSPDYYEYLKEEEKEGLADLSQDFCVITYPDQTDRFIRTTMTLRIIDACEDLDYGIWVSVSEHTFNEYRAEFKNSEAGRTYFGRICNEIPDYEESTLGLHVNIETRADGVRPEIFPHDSPHTLIKDWSEGITMQEARKRIDNLRRSSSV